MTDIGKALNDASQLSDSKHLRSGAVRVPGAAAPDHDTHHSGRRRRPRRPIVEMKYGPQDHNDVEFGGRTLGFWSSLVLLVNNITGPGMLALPIAFTKGGVTFSLVQLFFFAAVGTLASLFICAAISRVPAKDKNGKENPRMEYCPLVAYYLNGRFHYATQFLYNFSLQTKTISSIIISAQVMDKFCVWAMGAARGVMIYPSVKFVMADPEELIPFSHLGDSALIISTGYMLSIALFMPLGLLNLDENAAFQWISGFIMIAILGQFGQHFASSPSYPDEIPWVTGPAMMMSVGVIMFCFTFIDTVPSWYNEKKPSVGPITTLTTSVIASTAIYVFIGVFGALAFPHIMSGNVLELMADQGSSSTMTQISVYMFSLSTIGLGIPIFCIIMRYNLYVGNVVGAWGSKFWGAIFPWLVSFFLYQGTGFVRFVSWTSLLFTNFTNFILPSYIYILSLDEEEARKVEEELSATSISTPSTPKAYDVDSVDSLESGDIDVLDMDTNAADKSSLNGSAMHFMSSNSSSSNNNNNSTNNFKHSSRSALASSSNIASDSDSDSDHDRDRTMSLGVLSSLLGPNEKPSALSTLSSSSSSSSTSSSSTKNNMSSTKGHRGGVIGTPQAQASTAKPQETSIISSIFTMLFGDSSTFLSANGKAIKPRAPSASPSSSSSSSFSSLQGGGGDDASQRAGDEPMIPLPMWIHSRYPRLVPWTVIYVMSLLSVVSIGIDVYFLIVYGIDLTDV